MMVAVKCKRKRGAGLDDLFAVLAVTYERSNAITEI